MVTDPVGSDRLDSWKEIAAYVKRSVRTVIRWETGKDFPVRRIPGGERQNVFAYRSEIDAWMRSGRAGTLDDIEEANLDSSPPPFPQPHPPLTSDPSPSSNGSSATLPAVRGKTRRRLQWLAAASLVVGLAAFAGVRALTPRRFLIGAERQITHNGTMKTRLLTDGSDLYFGEWRDGRLVVSAVSVKGGAVRTIPTPFIQAQPVALTPGSRELLALVGEGQEQERPLWFIPLHGGAPRPAGTLLCHSAALSPDGSIIACAFGNAIYLSTDQGATHRLLQLLPGVPHEMRWSLDGKRMIFELRNVSSWRSSIWELRLSDAHPPGTVSLFPLDLPEYDYGVISPVLNDQDDLFLETGADQFSISVLQRARLSWNRKLVATEIVRQLNPLGDLAVDSKSKCLYATRTHGGTVELDRFYQASGQFRPFLPGIPATAVDFSRDGKSIVFVHEPEHMLWVSGVDGSDARQMDTGDVHEIELPRWSPDGKQIAFMGRTGGAPFRIFVIPAAGGKSREASEGTDNQGAPTWSPDGRRLVYGRVRCQEEKTCAIQEIDLKNHRQTMVPGSEGLTTARWSPDGRYVAALRDDRHEVFLLDRHNGEWRKIAEGVNGNDLSWGKDSRTIYASRPGSQRPEVLRISVKDGKAVNAFDLSPFSKLSGRIDTWFAMAPDDSILFLRFTSSDEVYAMSYLER